MASLRTIIVAFFSFYTLVHAACPPGKEKNSETGACEPCLVNFFKSNVGPGPCQKCPPNSVALPGSVSCFSCPPNQTLFANGRCDNCPPGSYYVDYLLDCARCEAGTFTDKPNISGKCHECPKNSYAGAGSSRCFSCPAGKVYGFFFDTQTSPQIPTPSCGYCSPGTFYNENNLACSMCGNNVFTARPNEEICKDCEEGTFARPGSASCFKCPPGQVYLEWSDACGKCPAGTVYWTPFAICTDPDIISSIAIEARS